MQNYKLSPAIIDYRNSFEVNFSDLEEIEELLKPYETYWKQQKQEGRN